MPPATTLLCAPRPGTGHGGGSRHGRRFPSWKAMPRPRSFFRVERNLGVGHWHRDLACGLGIRHRIKAGAAGHTRRGRVVLGWPPLLLASGYACDPPRSGQGPAAWAAPCRPAGPRRRLPKASLPAADVFPGAHATHNSCSCTRCAPAGRRGRGRRPAKGQGPRPCAAAWLPL